MRAIGNSNMKEEYRQQSRLNINMLKARLNKSKYWSHIAPFPGCDIRLINKCLILRYTIINLSASTEQQGHKKEMDDRDTTNKVERRRSVGGEYVRILKKLNPYEWI